MKYVTSKKECQKQIKGVCPGCGGKLEPIETEDNSGDPTFWVCCKHCQKFRCGIDKIYFDIARELVVKREIIPFSHMYEGDYTDTPWRHEFWLESQTAGLSHTILLIHNMIKEKLGEAK